MLDQPSVGWGRPCRTGSPVRGRPPLQSIQSRFLVGFSGGTAAHPPARRPAIPREVGKSELSHPGQGRVTGTSLVGRTGVRRREKARNLRDPVGVTGALHHECVSSTPTLTHCPYCS